MDFSSAHLVEQVIWDMRVADLPRGDNRSQIDRLFNGFPPWTQQEAHDARINTNVNFLDAPKLAADARRSYYNAFLKPARFFTLKLEDGPPQMRGMWSECVTQSMNEIMKGSLSYFEVLRSQVAATVLHGKGPSHWPDRHQWCPIAVDLPNLMIPSSTLLSGENLDHFSIFRQYTAPRLSAMIEGKNVDKGWNIPLARKAVQWAMQQPSHKTDVTDYLAPEKIVEEIVENAVYYGSDAVPTIDCWDFYFYCTKGDKPGWKRRIVLDTPAPAEAGQTLPEKSKTGTDTGQWLYNSGDRIYADDISEILHFQFGDLSAKAPFKYHSVRSLGWLIYAVCHLQNRLRCKRNDATFENLLNYFRVANADDVDRLTKIELHNYGVIPEGVEFVRQQDRWQINHALVDGTMQDNRSQMNEAASQFREGRDLSSTQEKTATQIMAEVNAANALVGTMLLLAYTYQRQQYKEIARRFFIKNSSDTDVKKFREKVLRKGVPEQLLDIDLWRVEPEQVIGSGNKILQIAMADKLMAVRPLLDPDAQRDVLRIYVEANSDDPYLGMRWVPPNPLQVTNSMHDAQLMIGSLMDGVQVMPTRGQSPGEVSGALLSGMAQIIQRIEGTTGQATAQEIVGLTNLGKAIDFYLQQLAQDPTQQDRVRQAQKDLAQLMNMVRNWSVALENAQQQGGQDKAQEKLSAMEITAQAQAEISKAEATQKMQQKDAQFQQKMQQDSEKHTATLRKQLKESATDQAIADAKTANEIQNQSAKQATTP